MSLSLSFCRPCFSLALLNFHKTSIHCPRERDRVPVRSPSGWRCSKLMKNDAYKPSGDKLTVGLEWSAARWIGSSDEFDRAFPDVIHVESILSVFVCITQPVCVRIHLCGTGRRAVTIFRSAGNVLQVNCGRQAPQLGQFTPILREQFFSPSWIASISPSRVRSFVSFHFVSNTRLFRHD